MAKNRFSTLINAARKLAASSRALDETALIAVISRELRTRRQELESESGSVSGGSKGSPSRKSSGQASGSQFFAQNYCNG
jgi:hypothetical protein